MNAQRRKELAKALELLGEAKTIIEGIRDEEQDSFDNLPEGLQSSERGEKMEENINNLESSIDSVDEAISSVEEASE